MLTRTQRFRWLQEFWRHLFKKDKWHKDIDSMMNAHMLTWSRSELIRKPPCWIFSNSASIYWERRTKSWKKSKVLFGFVGSHSSMALFSALTFTLTSSAIKWVDAYLKHHWVWRVFQDSGVTMLLICYLGQSSSFDVTYYLGYQEILPGGEAGNECFWVPIRLQSTR